MVWEGGVVGEKVGNWVGWTQMVFHFLFAVQLYVLAPRSFPDLSFTCVRDKRFEYEE